MDFKSLLQSMDNISEDTVHKAKPGGYGNRYGSETQTDQYGKPIGKVSLASLGPKDDTPAKRGRPVDPDKPKTGKDDPKNKKVGDIFGRTTGNVPKGKKGRKHTPMKDADKAEKKAEKAAKKGLKEYVEEVETNQQLQEAEQISIAPAQQNTQVIKQGQKVLGTVTNPQLAAQIKQSIGKGEMSLNPNQQQGVAEEGGEKWIKGAIKHPGAFTKKAKAHGMSTSAFANKVLSNKEDYPAKTEKQASLAKTLSKMHESKLDESVNLAESPETLQHIINKFKHEVKTFMHTGELDDQLYDALFDYYMHSGEMPYGVAKARTGDPFAWISQRLQQDLPDHVEEGQYTTHGMDSGPKSMEPSRIQTPNKPVPNPTPFSVDPINATTDRAINFISGLRKPKQNPFEGKEMKDVQLESWETQLKGLLTEGITVSSSTGQQGSPDTVSVTASDADADQLLQVLRQAGVGVFGGNEQPMSQYGAPMSAPGEEPEGHGTEPEQSPEVVGDDGDMLALIKKMTGIDAGGEEQPAGTATSDYEDEEGGEACDDCGHNPCSCDDHDEGEDSGKEEQTDEGNAFSGAVAKAKADGVQPGEKINVGGKEYPVKEDDMEEGNMFTGNLAKARAAGKEEADLDGDGDMEKVKEGEESCNECGMYESECDCDHEQVEESEYANSDDDQHMQDLYYMINTITGGLNGKKRDQTVLNPTQVKVTESDAITDWKKLSGIK